MAKVKTNFKELSAAIQVPITGPGSLQGIGDFMVKRIKAFTRLGYSLAGNPPDPRSVKLLELNPGYIRRRRFWPSGLANPPKGGVGTSFVAGRSQLTASGQMLESITYVANPAKKSVRVFVGSSQRNDGHTNVEIAKKNIDAGRPFMGLDRVGIETIKNRYVSYLLRRKR